MPSTPSTPSSPPSSPRKPILPRLTSLPPISPPLPPPRDNLCSRSLIHLKTLLTQCLKEAYLEKGPWATVLMDVAVEVATDIPFVVEALSTLRKKRRMKDDVNVGVGVVGNRGGNVVHHVLKVVCVQGGRPEESHYVPGSDLLLEDSPTPNTPTPTTTTNSIKPSDLGGTIILRGVPTRDTLVLEKITDLLAFTATHLKLEMHLYAGPFSSFVPLSPSSLHHRLHSSTSRKVGFWAKLSGEQSGGDSVAIQQGGGGGGGGGGGIDGIEETCISCSPDVFLPAPYLLVRLRDEEFQERMEREENGNINVDVNSRLPIEGGTLTPLKSDATSPTTPTKRAHRSSGQTQSTKITVDSKNRAMPCQPPKILTVEYYRKRGEYEDKTLGEYVEMLCGERGVCPDRGCGKSMTSHVITYAHHGVRVSVGVEDCPSIPMTGSKSTVGQVARPVCTRRKWCPSLRQRGFYSWGKYLEVLCYSAGFFPRCGHRERGGVRRAFGWRGKGVWVECEEVDLFEMRVPKIQVMPEHLVPPVRRGGYPTPGSSPGVGRKDEGTVMNIRGYVSAESGMSKGLSLDSSADMDDTPFEDLPFGLNVTAAQLVDGLRLDILYFYGSLKDHLHALSVATGREAVEKNRGSVEQVRCQIALDEMGRRYGEEERELYGMVRRCQGRCDVINNVRRVVGERVLRCKGEVEGWQRGNAAGCGIQAAWFFPEYVSQKSCHVYPDSFVIIREDEPTSILAYTLTCKEYLDQVAILETQTPVDVDTPQGSSSPTLTANTGVQAASAAALAVAAAAAAAADLARWELQEEFRVRAKLFTHDVTGAKQHVKLRFAEGKMVFVCTVYYAEQFETLRRRCGVTGPYVQSLLRCKNWNATGGKSRAVFFKTHANLLVSRVPADDQLVIKQLASNWTLVEKDALLKFAPLYFSYMQNSDKNATLDVLVMDHLFANVKISRRFDLKGVPDRHYEKREGEVGWDGDWVDGRYKGLLMLHGHSKWILGEGVKNDTAFLASANVMDYSLLVGVNDEKKELVVGIVDFIGPYTWYKRIENRGKTTLRGRECTVLPPDQYGERFRKAMDQYFLMVPDKWIKIPGQENGDKSKKRLPPVL
ncbi:hypothetical protein BC829DRAFT_443950 [Chytridium lagenaria]|nr:hypothetical protein BC829DRAFT_443950 [Chytridium lagenaria]